MKPKAPKIKDIRASKGEKLRKPSEPLDSDLPSPIEKAKKKKK